MEAVDESLTYLVFIIVRRFNALQVQNYPAFVAHPLAASLILKIDTTTIGTATSFDISVIHKSLPPQNKCFLFAFYKFCNCVYNVLVPQVAV
jgi:hypothetical protein